MHQWFCLKNEDKHAICFVESLHSAQICLAAKDIVLRIPYLKLLNTASNDLVNFIRDSNKRINLHKFDEDNVDILSLIKSIDIRWFTNYSAMKRILETFSSLITTINEFKEEFTQASYLLKTFTNVKFLKKYSAYVDALCILNALSTSFQKRGLFVNEVINEYRNTIASFDNLLNKTKGLFSGFWYNKVNDEYQKSGCFNNQKL